MAFSEEQRDGLQEITNVAIGKAGDTLARYLGVFVNLSVPKIKLSETKRAGDLLYTMVDKQERVIAVKQPFNSSNSDLQGDGIVLFTKPTLEELVKLVGDKAKETTDETVSVELLLETAKIINSECLSGLGEQLDVALTANVCQV